MSERMPLAVVAVQFIDAEREDGAPEEDIRLGGRTVTWTTEDITTAETLVSQLTGLLGEPYAESIQPEIAYRLIKGVAPMWPGQVNIIHKEDA